MEILLGDKRQKLPITSRLPFSLEIWLRQLIVAEMCWLSWRTRLSGDASVLSALR